MCYVRHRFLASPDVKKNTVTGREATSLRTLLYTALIAGILWSMLTLTPQAAFAGPPFITDDPEPVAYRHWEIYLASQYKHDRDQEAATFPHVEINYGLIPNVQVHLIAPMQYVKPEGQSSQYGYGIRSSASSIVSSRKQSTSLRWAYFRSLSFPRVILPRDWATVRPNISCPFWLQKSWGPWTTYGGGGYWVNPGEGNRDWWQFGWQLQREINKS